MTKATFNKKEPLSTSKLDSKFKQENSKMLRLEYRFAWFWNSNTSESRSQIAGKFWNVVLEKDWEDQVDRSCEKWKRYIESRWKGILYTAKRGKANWVVHNLGRNCLLQHVTVVKIERRSEWKTGKKRWAVTGWS